MIDGSADRAFDGSQPKRRVRVTRPETLLRRILSNVNLGDRYRNVRVIQRGDRPIMEAICARVARSGIPGVYVPDPMMAGTTSLAELVAYLYRRAMMNGSTRNQGCFPAHVS